MQAMLRDWCRWMGVNAQRSLLLLDIPENCGKEEIQKAVRDALRPMGRCRVLGKVFRKELGTEVALVEFAGYLNQSVIPQQIPGREGPWRVICMPQVPQAESQELPALPVQPQGQEVAGGTGEGRAAGVIGAAGEEALEEVAGAAAEDRDAGEAGEEDAAWAASEAGAASEEGVRAEAGVAGEVGAAGDAGYEDMEAALGAAASLEVSGGRGSVQDWAQRWKHTLQYVMGSLSYEELRPFSGFQEPGFGEESLESWLDHAYDMLYLWRHLSEQEKRQRLMESLSGLALEVLVNLLSENPGLPAQDCLIILAQVLSPQDALTTAWLELLACTQEPEECLFDYLMRQEGLLQKAIEKGAVHRAKADQVRIRQVLMRARPSPMLCTKLRWMRMEGRAPAFSGLLQLVQETEALEADQLKEGPVSRTVAMVHPIPAEHQNIPALEEDTPVDDQSFPATKEDSTTDEEEASADDKDAPASEEGGPSSEGDTPPGEVDAPPDEEGGSG